MIYIYYTFFIYCIYHGVVLLVQNGIPLLLFDIYIHLLIEFNIPLINGE